MEYKIKKNILRIKAPYKWYTSPVQMARYYIPKGVVYIVK